MSNITKFAAGGLRKVQVGVRGSGGFFAGFAGLTAADTGEVSGMRVVDGAVTAPSPASNRNLVYPRKDDGYGKPFNFEGQPNEFGLVFEQMDKDLKNLLIGTTLYTVNEWDFSAGGVQGQTYQDTIWLLTREGYSTEPGSEGEPGFDNMLILSSTFSVDEGDMAFQAVGDVTYTGSPSAVSKLPWGVSTVSVFGKAAMQVVTFFTQYVPTLVCFIGDGTEDEIALPVTPISVAKTKFWNFDTGAALTTSSVNTSTDTATLSAAPGSGVEVVGVVETTDY